MARESEIDNPDKRVRAQQTLAAAIDIRNSSGSIDVDLLDRVLTSAEAQELPIHFAIATALLRRPELNEASEFVLRIARLAAKKSTKPETFVTDDAASRLAKAIRGAELDKPPTSWWREREPNPRDPNDSDTPPVVFIDQSAWVKDQGFSEEWGLSLTEFAAGSS